MTGPEHYREAERLLVRADHYVYGDGADAVAGHAVAAQAQAHATLALAAATAMGAVGADLVVRTAIEWVRAIVPPRKGVDQ